MGEGDGVSEKDGGRDKHMGRGGKERRTAGEGKWMFALGIKEV